MSKNKNAIDIEAYFRPNEQVDPEVAQAHSDAKLLIACHRGNFKKVQEAVETYNADVDAGTTRALFYALNSCSDINRQGEKIIKYLINRGAEVNFRHGPVHLEEEYKPYFIFFVANNDYVSDDIVYFVADKSSYEALTDAPQTRFDGKRAIDIIREKRPNVYDRLMQRAKVIESNKR